MPDTGDGQHASGGGDNDLVVLPWKDAIDVV